MNPVKKTLGLTAAALVTMASVAACGSDNDYCDTYDKAKQEINGLDFSNMDDLDKAQNYTKRLRDAAPNDKVQSAWEDYNKAIEGIRDALDKAGVSLGDFQKLRGSNELPDDVSQKQALEMVTQVGTIVKKHNVEDSQKTTKKYAKKHCESDS